VDTTKELPTVLSFCSGYGGIERGLDLAGFKHRTVAYVEIEAYAIANLANKMEAGKLLPAPIWSNLKTLPVQPFRDKVDLITGGYPCQPFSAAGQRKGTDDPRHLWPYIRQHIEAIRPVQCFFENVEGHISLGLREVISDLESLGYSTTWGIFSAREVGAPHQRKRVYILADRQSFICERSKLKRGRGGESQMSSGVRGVSGANILADSNGVRCDRRQLPDRVSERSMEIEAQQRPQQSVVRSEVKGCRGDSGEDVADSDSERWAKHDRKQGSSSKGKRTDKGRGQTIRSGATGANILADSREDVADSNSNQQRPRGGQEQSQRYTAGQCSSDSGTVGIEGVVADSSGKGLQRGGISRNISGKESQPDDQFAPRCNSAQIGEWEPEPGVGRVAHGIADRVDRIRMLGNGIVPQTAAKAWSVLSKRMEITQ
jgi:site-specific DNA-cytosine methylase